LTAGVDVDCTKLGRGSTTGNIGCAESVFTFKAWFSAGLLAVGCGVNRKGAGGEEGPRNRRENSFLDAHGVLLNHGWIAAHKNMFDNNKKYPRSRGQVW
jgi:hypothetical protein